MNIRIIQAPESVRRAGPRENSMCSGPEERGSGRRNCGLRPWLGKECLTLFPGVLSQLGN